MSKVNEVCDYCIHQKTVNCEVCINFNLFVGKQCENCKHKLDDCTKLNNKQNTTYCSNWKA